MIRGILVFSIGFLLTAGAGWMVAPDWFYKKVEQPVSFNHQVHTKKNEMACADCHAFTEAGEFAGLPKLEGCAACHTEAMGETKAEKDFIEAWVKPNREPAWLSYSRQPDNAWFPHSVHVKRAAIACEKCHDKHGETTVLAPVEVNRISGYNRAVMGRPAGPLKMQHSGGMRMSDCVDCHREKGFSHSCMDCHR